MANGARSIPASLHPQTAISSASGVGVSEATGRAIPRLMGGLRFWESSPGVERSCHRDVRAGAALRFCLRGRWCWEACRPASSPPTLRRSRPPPNDPEGRPEQLSAGRPRRAEVRPHGLGNPRYPGYPSHYEQTGWSVPHFVLIIGYDGTGVWLNDPGISWGRGYHITYAQLAHAIDDLDQHHPALDEGQVLLLVAPDAPQNVRPGNI